MGNFIKKAKKFIVCFLTVILVCVSSLSLSVPVYAGEIVATLGGYEAVKALLFGLISAGAAGAAVESGYDVENPMLLGPTTMSDSMVNQAVVAAGNFLVNNYSKYRVLGNATEVNTDVINQVVLDVTSGALTMQDLKDSYDSSGYTASDIYVDSSYISSCSNSLSYDDIFAETSSVVYRSGFSRPSFGNLSNFLSLYDLSVVNSVLTSDCKQTTYKLNNSFHVSYANCLDHSLTDHFVSCGDSKGLSSGFMYNASPSLVNVYDYFDGTQRILGIFPVQLSTYYHSTYDYPIIGIRIEMNTNGQLSASWSNSYYMYGNRTSWYSANNSYVSYGFASTLGFDTYQPPHFISSSLPLFDSIDAVNAMLADLAVDGVIDLAANPTYDSKVSSKDIADSDVAVIPPGGCTLQDIYNILEGLHGKDFASVSDYVTDARQYITINEGDHTTTINEGDTITTVVSTYDDSGLLSNLGSWFDSIASYLSRFADAWSTCLQYVGAIADDIPSISQTLKRIWERIADDIPAIGKSLSDIAHNVSDIPDFLSKVIESVKDLPTYLEDILSELSGSIDIVWPAVFPWELEAPDIVWPWELDADWTLPIVWPWEIDADWTLPIVWPWEIDSDWTLPISIPVDDTGTATKPWDITLPDIFPIDWQTLFDWLCPDFDVIAIPTFEDTIGMPTGFTDFKGAIIDPFVGRYKTVDYPVFTIDTPDILKPFLKTNVIVLLDTQDHAELFSKVRYIIKFCLYFGFILYLIRRAQHLFTYDDAIDGGAGGFYLSK